MHGQKLASIMMAIGLSLAWKAASAETIVPTAPYEEKATMPLSLATDRPALRGTASKGTALRGTASERTASHGTMSRSIVSLYHDATSVLPALQQNWWTEPSAQIRVMTVSPQEVRSRTRESISRITDVTWGSWKRPL